MKHNTTTLHIRITGTNEEKWIRARLDLVKFFLDEHRRYDAIDPCPSDSDVDELLHRFRDADGDAIQAAGEMAALLFIAEKKTGLRHDPKADC
jgi:hypothetical protein